MSGSVYPWLEQIPNPVQVKRLKHNTYIKARVGWHGLSSDEHQDTGPYLVTGTDFARGEVSWSACTHVTNERWGQDPYIQLVEGDLLVTKDGTIGKVALVGELPGPATLNSGVFVLRPLHCDYVTRYLYWVLRSHLFESFIELISHGSTINHLYQRQINEFPLPIWSLPTQRAVADFLDRKTAAIDALIEKKKKLLDLLAEKRAALINQAVTKGLDPNVPMKDSGIPWIGEIPAHWDTIALRRVGHVDQGNSFPHALQRGNSGGIPWYKIKDMTSPGNEVIMNRADNYVDEQIAASARITVFPASSIIFPRVGAALLTNKRRILSQPAIIDDNTYGFIPEDVDPWYALHVFSLVDLASLCSPGLVPTVTVPTIKSIHVPLAPRSEQVAVVAHISRRMRLRDEVATQNEVMLDRLREYRQALITAAVTGQIDVTKEDN